jgi:ATP-dependent RNA helicase DDX5/DBP2
MQNRFRAVAIHGDKSQRERDFVLNKFREDRQAILIATDVASRGLGKQKMFQRRAERNI